MPLVIAYKCFEITLGHNFCLKKYHTKSYYELTRSLNHFFFHLKVNLSHELIWLQRAGQKSFPRTHMQIN